jgi:uncharacterized membrane protein YgcG
VIDVGSRRERAVRVVAAIVAAASLLAGPEAAMAAAETPVRILDQAVYDLGAVWGSTPEQSAESLASTIRSVADADVVVVATNHSEFEQVLAQVPRDAWLVDPWNVSGSGQVFAFVEELAPIKA